MRARENRRAPRVKRNTVLELFDGQGRQVEAVVRLVDYSVAGLRFATAAHLAPGDRVRACLSLMREGLLYVEGRVVWKRAKGSTTLYGVEFSEPPRQLAP
ncbi:MAG: PilZ domain-containing protein [Elusimicrobia bacterium]|nr:PilZ domain-containing protein [Elusimicrobiota bacterium]